MISLKLIFYDFDGVMTDNKVYVDQLGKEMVQVNRADGLGISLIKKLGIEQVIISTETNQVVSKRAEKLKIKCLQGINNKSVCIEQFCSKNNFNLINTGYVGNDINDLEAMKMAGVSFCPSNSHPDIIKISRNILKKKGGDGVIRELYDLIKQNYEHK